MNANTGLFVKLVFRRKCEEFSFRIFFSFGLALNFGPNINADSALGFSIYESKESKKENKFCYILLIFDRFFFKEPAGNLVCKNSTPPPRIVESIDFGGKELFWAPWIYFLTKNPGYPLKEMLNPWISSLMRMLDIEISSFLACKVTILWISALLDV